MRNSMVAVFLSMLSLAAILPVSAEGTCAKWFRLTLKEKYRIKSSASNLRLAEFALDDRDGEQQGRGLTAVDAATEPSAMAEGTCLVQTPYSVAVGPACLFDGAYSGDSTSNFSINGIPVDGDGYPAMSVSDSST